MLRVWNSMKITRKQLRRLVTEAMFSPRAARATARGKVQKSIPTGKMSKLDDMLDSEDEEAAIQGHHILDTLGDYDSPMGTESSYQDIEGHDQAMEDVSLAYKKASMVDDFEKYTDAAVPTIASSLYRRLYKGSDVDLYVTSVDQKKNLDTPGSEVIRNPEAFHLMAIDTNDNDFAYEVEKVLRIEFGDDTEAIFALLEKMATEGSVIVRPIGHVPEGYQFSPEHAFIAWITENNPNLRIFVDP